MSEAKLLQNDQNKRKFLANIRPKAMVAKCTKTTLQVCEICKLFFEKIEEKSLQSEETSYIIITVVT